MSYGIIGGITHKTCPLLQREQAVQSAENSKYIFFPPGIYFQTTLLVLIPPFSQKFTFFVKEEWCCLYRYIILYKF